MEGLIVRPNVLYERRPKAKRSLPEDVRSMEGLGPTAITRNVPAVATDQLLVALERHDFLPQMHVGRSFEQTPRDDVFGRRESQDLRHGKRLSEPVGGVDECLNAIASASERLADGVGDLDVVSERAEANVSK